MKRVFDEIENLLPRRANLAEELALLIAKHSFRVTFPGAIRVEAVFEQLAKVFCPVVIVHAGNKAHAGRKFQTSNDKSRIGSKRQRNSFSLGVRHSCRLAGLFDLRKTDSDA